MTQRVTLNFIMWDSDAMKTDTIIAAGCVSLCVLEHGKEIRMDIPMMRPGKEGSSSGFLTVGLLAKDFSGLKAEVDRLSKIEDQLQTTVAELGGEVQKLKDIEGSLRAEVSTLHGTVEELRAVAGELKAEVGRLQAVEARLNEGVASLEKKLQLMQSTVDDLVKVRDSLDAQVDRLDEQNTQLKGHLDDLKSIEEGMKAYAEQAGESFGEFVKQMTSQISRNEKLLSDFSAENAKLRDNRRKQQLNMLLQMSTSFQNWDHKVGLSPEEFAQYLTMLGPQYEQMIREKISPTPDNAFGVLDLDKSGTLNVQELRSMLEAILKDAE